MISKHAALALISYAFFTPDPAQAVTLKQKASQLSEENITAFIEEMNQVAMGHHNLSPPDLETYLDDHLHEKGRYTSTITYDIPGYPAQNNEIKLDKESLSDSYRNITEETSGFETQITIENIEIKHRGQSATIQTLSKDKGTLHLPAEDGSEKSIPVKGSSHCEQNLRLSSQNMIQLVKAVCSTEIIFDPFGGKELDDYDF